VGSWEGGPLFIMTNNDIAGVRWQPQPHFYRDNPLNSDRRRDWSEC
jgi:hypothetical protein